MLGMSALLYQIIRRFVAHPNVHELLFARVVLSEMSTQSTLSVVQRNHSRPPPYWDKTQRK
jgi:hypothetical protein